jgi:hypothetical protein
MFARGGWAVSSYRACQGGPSEVEQRDVVRSRPGLDEVGDDLPTTGTNLNPWPEKPQASIT